MSAQADALARAFSVIDVNEAFTALSECKDTDSYSRGLSALLSMCYWDWDDETGQLGFTARANCLFWDALKFPYKGGDFDAIGSLKDNGGIGGFDEQKFKNCVRVPLFFLDSALNLNVIQNQDKELKPDIYTKLLYDVINKLISQAQGLARRSLKQEGPVPPIVSSHLKWDVSNINDLIMQFVKILLFEFSLVHAAPVQSEETPKVPSLTIIWKKEQKQYERTPTGLFQFGTDAKVWINKNVTDKTSKSIILATVGAFYGAIQGKIANIEPTAQGQWLWFEHHRIRLIWGNTQIGRCLLNASVMMHEETNKNCAEVQIVKMIRAYGEKYERYMNPKEAQSEIFNYGKVFQLWGIMMTREENKSLNGQIMDEDFFKRFLAVARDYDQELSFASQCYSMIVQNSADDRAARSEERKNNLNDMATKPALKEKQDALTQYYTGVTVEQQQINLWHLNLFPTFSGPWQKKKFEGTFIINKNSLTVEQLLWYVASRRLMLNRLPGILGYEDYDQQQNMAISCGLEQMQKIRGEPKSTSVEAMLKDILPECNQEESVKLEKQMQINSDGISERVSQMHEADHEKDEKNNEFLTTRQLLSDTSFKIGFHPVKLYIFPGENEAQAFVGKWNGYSKDDKALIKGKILEDWGGVPNKYKNKRAVKGPPYLKIAMFVIVALIILGIIVMLL